MVGGVAGGVGDLQPDDRLAAAQRSHVLLGHGQDLAPEVAQSVAVEALGARQQLRGIDQVRGAALVDVDLEVGPAPHQSAGRGGVVEMNVGQEQRPRPLVADRLQHGPDRGLRPGIDQGAVDLPAADHVGATQVLYVYDAH